MLLPSTDLISSRPARLPAVGAPALRRLDARQRPAATRSEQPQRASHWNAASAGCALRQRAGKQVFIGPAEEDEFQAANRGESPAQFWDVCWPPKRIGRLSFVFEPKLFLVVRLLLGCARLGAPTNEDVSPIATNRRPAGLPIDGSVESTSSIPTTMSRARGAGNPANGDVRSLFGRPARSARGHCTRRSAPARTITSETRLPSC
jgi:hypothetical protein